MNRQHAINKAEYFRVGAAIINAQTAEESICTNDIVSSVAVQKELTDKDGKVHMQTVYQRKVSHGPSISAAKRKTRSLRGVVVQQKGEDFRALARRNKRQNDIKDAAAAVKSAQEALDKAMTDAHTAEGMHSKAVDEKMPDNVIKDCLDAIVESIAKVRECRETLAMREHKLAQLSK
jgi:hypothetical protein